MPGHSSCTPTITQGAEPFGWRWLPPTPSSGPHPNPDTWINETTSRCVAVVDHPYCYSSLAMMALSFEKAGVDLQVDPYTVVIPYEPRDEEEVAETDVSNDVGVV